MDEIVIGEKKYISSKQAAKATGYAKDYIGQLCREGRVPARLVGRSWYVLESAIHDHRFGDLKNELIEPEKIILPAESTLQSTWESPRYEASKTEVLPSVSLSNNEFAEPTGAKDEEGLEAAQRLQDTWQAWFDRFEHITKAVEVERPEEKEEEREEPKPEPEQQKDTIIPVRAVYEPEQQLAPEEILPQYAPTQSAQNTERKEKRSWEGHRRILMAIQVSGVLVATLAAIAAMLGSGYLDSYILSNSQARIIAGVALYNK